MATTDVSVQTMSERIPRTLADEGSTRWSPVKHSFIA